MTTLAHQFDMEGYPSRISTTVSLACEAVYVCWSSDQTICRTRSDLPAENDHVFCQERMDCYIHGARSLLRECLAAPLSYAHSLRKSGRMFPGEPRCLCQPTISS
jgi:hypothetical protein